MKIHFYIRFHTRYGQTMAVTGNCGALGNHSIEHAFSLEYVNNEFWRGSLELDPAGVPVLNYNYVLKNAGGYHVIEWGSDREIDLGQSAAEEIQVLDTWNHAGEYENAFYTDPFQNVLLKENETRLKYKLPKSYTHLFKVKAPLLKKNEVLCLVGSGKTLDAWNTTRPVLLTRTNGWWVTALQLSREDLPLSYKYGIYNIEEQHFVSYEEGANRILYGDVAPKKAVILHDGFAHLPNTTWKGAGVYIPVFSLRSRKSFGVGEFNDLKLLVDWAKKTGLKLIQILPVNDTTATHTWTDTYPYAAISAFALHPMYIHLEKLAGKEYAELLRPLKKKQKHLNDLADLDYEEMMKYKLSAIRELYAAQKEQLFSDRHYLAFFEKNKDWLVPYAAFCHLRDKHGTSDFTQWKIHSRYDKAVIEKFTAPGTRHFDHIGLHYFIQYHLDRQLQDAAQYAHKNGIIIKGDIPIGVYRYGCDTWVEPDLFHLEVSAGAPPDDFAIKGQNWGFPTYNWEKMAGDHFEWWHRRFVHMVNYFDAFRIDHILGFFRIWSIPTDSIEGIMGYFVPALPIHINEFHEKGIWFDYHRYCRPFINDAVLWELFGPNSEKFKCFLHSAGNGEYRLKEEFHTQLQVEKYFADLPQNDENAHLKQGLFDLISNVILFEQPGSAGKQFHFRILVDHTTSFRHLEWHTRQQLNDLYIDYFYRRQDDFWMKEAMKKLPALKRSTNMLVCGEDLGMVPHCVPDVMKQLGILSLEIQRMPKDPNREFTRLAGIPYLSVVTPSTHDMSTLRGWWEEDPARTRRFFNLELGQWGDAPPFCEPWISKAIVQEHLCAPAMWAIFQLQDLLGMSATIRRENPHEERINVPSNPRHYWKYRMHLTLEQLLNEKEFNGELKTIVRACHR